MVVIDAGEVLQAGTPQSIHRAPRNARVADLVGIHNRFEGFWSGSTGMPGRGLLHWKVTGEDQSAAWPALDVVDKGRLRSGQSVNWVIPGDAISLQDAPPTRPGEFAAVVSEARHLGEITLASVALADWRAVTLQLTLAGPQQRQLAPGMRITLALDLSQVHVMPLKAHGPL
jgi:molybdate transport system ATP-binding protein